MPLTRRLPKRGFTNPFREEYQVVSLDQLEALADGEVTPESLHGAGLIGDADGPGEGAGATASSRRPSRVARTAFSARRREKIERPAARVEE